MGSDIQSLVPGTNAFSPIGSIIGQSPAEEEQIEGYLFHSLALIIFRLRMTHLRSQPLTA